MRTKSLLCTLRRVHTAGRHAKEGSSSGLSARPTPNLLSRTTGPVNGSNRVSCRANADADTALAKPNLRSSLGAVRFMGIGSFKEGNRSGQHSVRLPQAKSDGSPEKAEQDCREEFLDKAKQKSAARRNEAEAPFRGAVESGGDAATTELKFGVKDGATTEEAIENASQELNRQSNVTGGDPEEPIKEEDKQKYTVADHGAENPQADVSNEIFGAKEHDGTSHFADDSDKPESDGRTNESVLGIGGRGAGKSLTDEATGSGESARENIEHTRAEAREGKARSPQAGVVVGNVPAVGANARETEGDIPQFAEDQDGGKALDQAQKQYEQAVAGFGPGGDKNLAADRSEAKEPQFHNT